MDVTIKEIAEKLKEYDNYFIVYHIRPDGDCIGTAFGLCLALQSIGKKCTVKGQDEIPRIHRYMTDKVQLDEIAEPVYIAVDSATRHRVGIYGDKHFTFCIDHHHNTFDNVDYRYVETDTGACAELIYKIIKEMGATVTKQIADLLYTAIVTDTMCFRTTDTRVQTFEVATELAKAGADVYHIGRINTFIKSAGRMKIENILRDSFHFTYNNQIVTGIIMLKDLETAGVLDSDIEGINSLVEQIEGVRIGVTIRELPDGRMRCSMRSNGEISSNDICRIHGGGGHFHAACCELDMSASEAREVMEKTCREYLESQEHGRIYAFIGASACGKTTLCTMLDKEYDTVHKVVTDTTRSPRKGEVDKVHYNFVSEQFFRDNIDNYVEHNEYDNHLYGSNGTRIANALDGGKADVVICLDINGAKALKKHYGDQVRVIYVHRDIEKIYAAIDERVANGEITAKSAVHRKEQVLRDIESRNDPVIDFEVDNNNSLDSSLIQLKRIIHL